VLSKAQIIRGQAGAEKGREGSLAMCGSNGRDWQRKRKRYCNPHNDYCATQSSLIHFLHKSLNSDDTKTSAENRLH
jgi:hypothetical protein